MTIEELREYVYERCEADEYKTDEIMTAIRALFKSWVPKKERLWEDASITECRMGSNEDQQTQDIYSKGFNACVDQITSTIDKEGE